MVGALDCRNHGKETAMSQSEEKKWLSLAGLQQVVSENPEVRKLREEKARIANEQKDLLVEQAGDVLDSRAARQDVIYYIEWKHKQGTLNYNEVNDLLVMNPVRLVRIARQGY